MRLVPLVIDEEGNQVVTQSNSLTEARYTLSVVEQRFVLTLLSYISPRDEDFKTYEIPLENFKRLMNIDRKEKEKNIKDLLVRMASHVVKIPTDEGLLISHWFSSALLKKDSVSLALDFRLKPYLLQLKQQFTQFNLKSITQFKSIYTIRIYMLLKQYESIGFREIELEEFKYIIGVGDEKYREYKHLNQWIIKPAKRDFEKKKNGLFICDISFDLKTIRTGRKISHLRFKIIKQSYQSSLNLPEPKSVDTTIADRLKAYGIRKKMLNTWLENYSNEYLEEKIALTEEKSRENPSGYLIKAVEEDWQSQSTKSKKKRKEEENNRKVELKALFDEEWKKLAVEKYYEDQIKKIEQSLDASILKGLRKEAEQSEGISYIPQGVRDSFINARYNGLLRERHAATPNEKEIEFFRKSTPPPALKTWIGNSVLHQEMQQHIKEFSQL